MTGFNNETIRELVSYSAIGVLAVILLGTIWYLRAKFRNLLLLMPPDTLRALSSRGHWNFESCQNNIHILPFNTHTQRERLGNEDFHHTPYYYKDDPPPTYSSLNFPDVFSVKKIEPPPSYGSILVVKPANSAI